MTCPKCGREITRKRGNLNYDSWQRAIRALFDRHVKECGKSGAQVEPEAERP